MHAKPLKYAALNISAATTELVKGILVLYPEARIVPRVTPLEDEDISMEVALPLRMEEIYGAHRSSPFHLRQRRLCLGQPEGHLHSAV
jgi:hypothetical protein